MLNVALVGCGFMGTVHANAYASLEDVKLTGFVDIKKAAREKFAEKHGGRPYSSLQRCLEREPVDIVSLCLPTDCNLQYVSIAANAKKHILLEKPIAIDLKTADQIVNASRRNGVFLMVGHVLRFWPEYVIAREMMRKKELGRIISVEATRLGQTPWSPWYVEPQRVGSGMLNLGIHDIDFLNWVFGPPRWVEARGTRSREGTWDDLNTLVGLPGGISASVKTCMRMPKGFPFTMVFRVRGTRAVIEYMFRASGNIETRDTAQRYFDIYREKGKSEAISFQQEDPYRREISYFVHCVKEGKQPELATGQDARLAAKVTLACVESARTGRRVTL